MKHRELIVAALDGKTLQWRYKAVSNGLPGEWGDFLSPNIAVQTLVGPSHQAAVQICDFHIKPVPDVVYTGTFTFFLEGGRVGLEKFPLVNSAVFRRLRLTVKTDENGVTTEHVEIVK